MAFSKKQLAVLLSARIVEPLGYTILFPFVNNMMENLLPEVPKAQIGKYSGAFESVFALSGIVFMYQWGRLSDRIGRKPVIQGGLCGVACSMFLLGTAQNIWWAWGARILGGMFCGMGSVMRAALAEISTKETEGFVYPLWTICFDLACIAGPTLGAILQTPAIQYPHSFLAKIGFLRQNPYFLPCGLIGSMAFCAMLLISLFFDETHPDHRKEKVEEVETPPPVVTETTALLPPVNKKEETPPPSLRELLSLSAVQQVLVNTFLLAFLAMSYDAGFALFAYSRPSLGGIALTPREIAICLSIKGGLSMFIAVTIFPIAKRKMSAGALYRIFAPCWIVTYALPPFLNMIARRGDQAVESPFNGLFVFLLPIIFCYVLGDLCFPLNMMSINAAAPGSSSLGAVNAIASMAGSLARGLGPAAFGLLYAQSAATGIPIVWIAFSCCALGTAIQCSRLRTNSQS